jgi:hypothetical protein
VAERQGRSTVAVSRPSAQDIRNMVQQRGAEATRALREVLHLPANLNDTTILGTSLAEVAAREMRQNPRFASEVRKVYDELSALQRPAGKRAQTKAGALPPLAPIRTDLPYRKSDPYTPPDPAFLTMVYGRQQLARALQDYTVDMLKQAAAKLEIRHPGTKPRNRGQKQPLIDYIVEQCDTE